MWECLDRCCCEDALDPLALEFVALFLELEAPLLLLPEPAEWNEPLLLPPPPGDGGGMDAALGLAGEAAPEPDRGPAAADGGGAGESTRPRADLAARRFLFGGAPEPEPEPGPPPPVAMVAVDLLAASLSSAS